MAIDVRAATKLSEQYFQKSCTLIHDKRNKKYKLLYQGQAAF
jgi:hypothetical protein